jgi:hypothetical protein
MIDDTNMSSLSEDEMNHKVLRLNARIDGRWDHNAGATLDANPYDPAD